MASNSQPAQTGETNSAAITARLLDVEKIEAVLTQVARDTAQEHARAGRKIPVWRDNQVVWIMPEIEDEGDAADC